MILCQVKTRKIVKVKVVMSLVTIEGAVESDPFKIQQRRPFSTQSNTSCDGATSESLLSRSSDEEDQTDQRDERY